MIVNIYTITMLFLAIVSFSLGGVLFYAVVKTLFQFDKSVPLDSKTPFEQRGYLIFLLACVVLSLRMLAWPWFYLMLQSFVSEVPGAMCMFGVTQILPTTVTFLQIIKPLSFFIVGGWLFCYFVDKRIPTTPLTRRILYFLLPICGVLFVDSASDIYYVLHMEPLISVSCCATFFDVPLRPSAMIPQALFGKHFQGILLGLYYTINIVLVGSLFASLSKKYSDFIPVSDKTLFYLQAGLALINIPIVILAFIEVIAPELMQLPFHHCMYCFVGNGMVPDGPIIFGLFIIGTFAIGWTGIIRTLCKNNETTYVTEKLLVRVNGLSAFCLLSSIIMVTVHLVLI